MQTLQTINPNPRMLQKPNLCSYTNGYRERERNMRNENCKSLNGGWIEMGHRKKTMQVHPLLLLLLQEEMGRERIQYLKGNAAAAKKKKGSSAKARNGSLGFWVVVVVHLRSLLQTSQKLQPTMLNLWKQNPILWRWRKKSSRVVMNESRLFFLFVFFFTSDLFYKLAKSATPKWSSKIGNGN